MQDADRQALGTLLVILGAAGIGPISYLAASTSTTWLFLVAGAFIVIASFGAYISVPRRRRR